MRSYYKFLWLLVLAAVFASTAAAQAVKVVGMYNGKYVVAADGYVLKLGQRFSEPALLNRQFEFRLLPRIIIDNEEIQPNFEVNEVELLKTADSHVFEKKTLQESTAIIQKISLEAKTISTELTFRNNGAEKIQVRLSLDFTMQRASTLFSTKLEDKKPSNFFALLPPSLEGQALGVVMSQDFDPAFENLAETDAYTADVEFALNPGVQNVFRITYRPFYATLEAEKAYPTDLSSHAAEPLLKTSGDGRRITLTQAKAADRVKELTAQIHNFTGTGEFAELRDADLASPTNSLEASLFYKQACANNNLSCRLVVGKKNDSYYAWVQAYADKWENIDAWKSLAQKPEYEAVYTEPEIEAHVFKTGDTLQAAYNGVQWLKGGADIPASLIFVAAVVAVFVILELKLGIITTAMKSLSRRRPAPAAPIPPAPSPPSPQVTSQPTPPGRPATPAQPAAPPTRPTAPAPPTAPPSAPPTRAAPTPTVPPAAPTAPPAAPTAPPAYRVPLAARSRGLDGNYEILKEDVQDYLSKEVLKHVKEKEGRVAVEEYAGALGFSKELIEYGIQFLVEQGCIKKKSLM